MHHQNCFITLTYSPEHLKSPKLHYPDWQNFAKALRREIFDTYLKKVGINPDDYKKLLSGQKKQFLKEHCDELKKTRISINAVGEYGDKSQRPHWHAIIFNWSPSDPRDPETSPRGDTTWQSDAVDRLWKKGRSNFGSVTFESAGYVSRYAAKKLIHGSDHEHDFHPLAKKSQKNAIGKTWLEKFYKDCFNTGDLVVPKSDGTIVRSAIPRYYEKWFKQHHPDEWLRYVAQIKIPKMEKAALRAALEVSDYKELLETRAQKGKFWDQPNTRQQIRSKILREKFLKLQAFQKDT